MKKSKLPHINESEDLHKNYHVINVSTWIIKNAVEMAIYPRWNFSNEIYQENNIMTTAGVSGRRSSHRNDFYNDWRWAYLISFYISIDTSNNRKKSEVK